MAFYFFHIYVLKLQLQSFWKLRWANELTIQNIIPHHAHSTLLINDINIFRGSIGLRHSKV